MPFPPLSYRNRNLFLEDVDLEEIARSAGTPVYVYSATAIRERYRR